MVDELDCPCKNCICVPICTNKDPAHFYPSCELIVTYLYTRKVSKTGGRVPHYDYHVRIAEVQKYLKHWRWKINENGGLEVFVKNMMRDGVKYELMTLPKGE